VEITVDSNSKHTQEQTVEQPNLRALNHANTAILLELLSAQPTPALEEWHTSIEVIDKDTGEILSVKVLY